MFAKMHEWVEQEEIVFFYFFLFLGKLEILFNKWRNYIMMKSLFKKIKTFFDPNRKINNANNMPH